MYIPNLKSAEDLPGAWDPVTATLNWCETNYTWSYYIAEWWNTVSNLVMICCGLHGALTVLKARGEKRFVLFFLGLVIVGLGSWAFHMTLSYPMQLVDELSMLFCVSIVLYCICEMKSEYHQSNYPLAFGLLFVAIFSSAAYVAIGHPVFHQVVYMTLVTVAVYKSIRHFYGHPKYFSMLLLSLAINACGFIVWKVDVHYCSTLRSLRAGPGRFVAPLLECHAWWHVFAGLGTYVHVVIMAAERSELTTRSLGIKKFLGTIPVLVAHNGHTD